MSEHDVPPLYHMIATAEHGTVHEMDVRVYDAVSAVLEGNDQIGARVTNVHARRVGEG